MRNQKSQKDRYTFDGDQSVEDAIDRDQKIVAKAVSDTFSSSVLRAIVLIGGYGRGEGGYCYKDGKPSPYNDYDYFVVFKGLSKSDQQQYNQKLHTLAVILEEEVGVEVDFAILAYEQLAHLPYTLMFSEMQWGHKIIHGKEDILNVMPSMPYGNLALSEFTRLLLNRGSLLLMNKKTLADHTNLDAGEREVFIKYLFKAAMAIGDATLGMRYHYHPSYPVKLERLNGVFSQSSFFDGIYAKAVDARFHPDYAQYQDVDIVEWQQQVIDLWLACLMELEEKRLGTNISDWAQYSHSSVNKGQSGEGGMALLRNLAINLRDFGLGELVGNIPWCCRYPRERLISSLPLLLSGDEDCYREQLGNILPGARETKWDVAANTFLHMWGRYS